MATLIWLVVVFEASAHSLAMAEWWLSWCSRPSFALRFAVEEYSDLRTDIYGSWSLEKSHWIINVWLVGVGPARDVLLKDVLKEV